MEELLKDPSVQTAVVVLIVTAINVLIAYIKQKWPNQAALVEKNWCYIQPAIEAAILKAREATRNRGAEAFLSAIISEATVMFADKYELLEGKPASDSEIIAARAEITKAVNNVTK